jgi:hypothetical protein
MAASAVVPETRHSRFWLYTPFVLLLLVAVAWTVAWFVIQDRVNDGLDRWLAAEGQAGRQWTCQDRSVGGYPFRIEVTCAALRLQRGEVSASLGRVQSVAQVYQPRHVITEVGGPLRLTDGRITVQGTWQLLEASVRGSSTGVQRASLVAEAPNLQVTGAAPTEIGLSSQRLEAHVRPNPRGQQDGAYDAAISILQARIPGLDALLGGAEPANLQLDVTATRAEGFRGRPVLDEVERWREADGRLKILLASLAKGPRRMEAKGELRLDEQHRPAGELTLAAAGIEGLIGNLTGGGVGGSVLGALLGQGPRNPPPAPGAPALSPLPPLRLDNGRVALGPFAVPNLRLPPLY